MNSTISYSHHNLASRVKHVEHLLLSDSRDITFLPFNILRKFLAFTFSVNADVHEAIKKKEPCSTLLCVKMLIKHNYILY